MWILTPSLTSRFAQATGESTLPSKESLANAFAQSLTQKSKVSPSRTWSQKLKRDTWTTHLSGAICDPSRGTSFTAWWVSCLADFRVSHSQVLESATLTPIRVTSSLPSSMVSPDADHDLFSWKMSRGSSAPSSPETNGATQPEPLFCSMSSASWSAWVTAQRQDYSRRAKQAHRTSANAPSSWPTIRASEYKDVGPVGSKSHQHMLGKHYLCAVVTQEGNAPSVWKTPQATDGEGGVMQIREGADGKYKLRDYAAKWHGLPDPENLNTGGNLQGWSTPTTTDAAAMSPELRPSRIATGRKTDYLARQVQWATPNNFCFQPPENTEQWSKRAEFQQGKGVNLHKPIQSQVLHENEKVMGPMPPSALRLNPRWVETLQGIPVGWVMPSCASPVTPVLMSCDSSETESACPPESEPFEL